MSSPLAVTIENSKGRRYDQRPHLYRNDFERDRDRIIHCEAFRRLEGKTQVFLHGLNDNYRNRLTHTIEVAQIGRTLARKLKLNEDLTEAICLAHDLGHSPFGHSGEKVMNELSDSVGGFEHNQQTLRIVDLLEHPYPDFEGLNLMYETRLGLAKHSSPYDESGQKIFSEKQCSLEGQIADISDRIAYNCHDLEDGMRVKLITDEQLKQIEIYRTAQDMIEADKISDKMTRSIRTSKAIIDILVTDCLESSGKNIEEAGLENLSDVFNHTEPLISISIDNNEKLSQLESFLFDNLYMHEEVKKTADKTRQWLETLFAELTQKPELMPRYYFNIAQIRGVERTVCDYIAGMTDDYCRKTLESIQ